MIVSVFVERLTISSIRFAPFVGDRENAEYVRTASFQLWPLTIILPTRRGRNRFATSKCHLRRVPDVLKRVNESKTPRRSTRTVSSNAGNTRPTDVRRSGFSTTCFIRIFMVDLRHSCMVCALATRCKLLFFG